MPPLSTRAYQARSPCSCSNVTSTKFETRASLFQCPVTRQHTITPTPAYVERAARTHALKFTSASSWYLPVLGIASSTSLQVTSIRRGCARASKSSPSRQITKAKGRNSSGSVWRAGSTLRSTHSAAPSTVSRFTVLTCAIRRGQAAVEGPRRARGLPAKPTRSNPSGRSRRKPEEGRFPLRLGNRPNGAARAIPRCSASPTASEPDVLRRPRCTPASTTPTPANACPSESSRATTLRGASPRPCTGTPAPSSSGRPRSSSQRGSSASRRSSGSARTCSPARPRPTTGRAACTLRARRSCPCPCSRAPSPNLDERPRIRTDDFDAVGQRFADLAVVRHDEALPEPVAPAQHRRKMRSYAGSVRNVQRAERLVDVRHAPRDAPRRAQPRCRRQLQGQPCKVLVAAAERLHVHVHPLDELRATFGAAPAALLHLLRGWESLAAVLAVHRKPLAFASPADGDRPARARLGQQLVRTLFDLRQVGLGVPALSAVPTEDDDGFGRSALLQPRSFQLLLRLG